MSQFFIDRPVFAWVLAIVVMLAGVLSITQMPVSHYPKVAAPSLAISVTYPGASAQTVQDTVVQVIEQQMNGIDGLRYIQSSSESDGSMSIALTFEQGTDPDIAQVQVQNKLQLASPLLPEEVQRQGLRVAEYQRNFMMVMALIDESGRMDNYDLGNYIASYLRDPISRVEGVGDFILLGSQYAMRIWLDPARLHSYQLTPTDVAAAVRAQNVQISAGQLGGLPSAEGVQLNATVTGKTRLETPEEFGAILLRVQEDGSQVRLRDVAEVRLGSESFGLAGNYNGLPGAAMALRLASGANLLQTSQRVHDAVKELEPYFPQGVKAVFPLETAPIVSDSIKSVLKTLVEAFGLVFLVMYLFLQNWRATLVPTLAIPVVLLGTMAVLHSLGYTINILTMYAMVLAIGLLVDDAIVVVENVERVMHDEKLDAREATRRSMGQIQGALVGIGLSLSAVFVPMAFFPGSAGAIYKQFSVTIVTAMALSVLVALIFTPALCASLLRSQQSGTGPSKSTSWSFFIWFNRQFARTSDRYQSTVTGVVRQPKRYLTVFVLIVAGLAYIFSDLPKSFLPNEDQGLMLVSVQLPSNSSAERTQASLDQIRDHLLNEESGMVKAVFSVNGFNFFGRGQSQGLMFVRMKPWNEREGDNTNIFALQQRLFMASAKFRDAQIIPAIPPAISEMGNASGVNAFIQDRAALGQEALSQGLQSFLTTLRSDPRVLFANHSGMPNAPQYRIEINDEKASAYQVSISDINATMAAAWGSLYINDFIDRGRVKRVYLQGEPLSRLSTDDFNRWYVRNAHGDMVPFAAFSDGYWTSGPTKLDRYNGVLAAEVSAQPAPGYSTSDLMEAFEDAMKVAAPGLGLSYTGMSYEERQTGNMATLLYALSLVVVFLCLAALYESWSIPVSVMLVVPLGVLGAVLATWLSGKNNDIFFQVGLLTTIGLASKNAILIVEFARSYLEEHRCTIQEAALAAARMRLRPIIMTSLAFTFGVLPMALVSGPGSESQNAIGVAVVGGMFGATFLAIIFVPLFFTLVQKVASGRSEQVTAEKNPAA